MKDRKPAYDVAVVGGAGHVGAPMSIVLASKGMRTLIYDLNRDAMDVLERGEMPFIDEGAEPLLREVLADNRLGFTDDISDLRDVPIIVITIGTPIDEFHNPDLTALLALTEELQRHLRDGQLLILRSTVFPGVTEYLGRYLAEHGRKVLLAFCPERVVQGRAVEEIQTLPQIVSGLTPDAYDTAVKFFSPFVSETVGMTTTEAEFAKLFCNAYRYIQFAASNQFYMMADAAGLNYQRILNGIKKDYPRMRELPGSGFAAGPCLFKDTLQLAAFSNNQFSMGQAAIQINEGLPQYLVKQLLRRSELSSMTVGLLGMAFKADSDDTRASLSYRLKKLLRREAKEVLTTDPFVTTDSELLPLEDVIARSDLLIVCAPHSAYRKLHLAGKPVLDIWNCLASESRQ